MKTKLMLMAVSASILSGAECVQPSTTIRSVDSPFVFSAAAISALATAHLAYEESLLSPERTVQSRDTRPLAAARTCVSSYMDPFLQSRVDSIREAASTFELAMNVLESNEKEATDELLRMSKQKASTQELSTYLRNYMDSGQGRWYIFLNAATSTLFSVGRFEDPKAGKSDIFLALQPDEAAFLRLELCRHFLTGRLMQPGQLRPSPQKAAAMLYQILKDGKITLSDPVWK